MSEARERFVALEPGRTRCSLVEQGVRMLLTTHGAARDHRVELCAHDVEREAFAGQGRIFGIDGAAELFAREVLAPREGFLDACSRTFGGGSVETVLSVVRRVDGVD